MILIEVEKVVADHFRKTDVVYELPKVSYDNKVWEENRLSIVNIAKSWLGTPYHHQASVKNIGVDCFGLVRGVWRELFDDDDPETPPPYSLDWAESSGKETLLEAARRHMFEVNLSDANFGDVIVFRHKKEYPAKHSAIITSIDADIYVIHAIQHMPVSEMMLTKLWLDRAATAFRFPLKSEI
jgi:NlpC/P60 family putative phage cell wall peptidase